MWNTNPQTTIDQESDDSWEVRAFEEDTNNALGTTWPPRSYTCTFCRREFRSAQALGGHMNVHRRDRARLHQSPPMPTTTTPTTAVIMSPNQHQELIANGGLCLIYSLPANPNFVFSTTLPMSDHCTEQPVSHETTAANFMPPPLPSMNFPVAYMHSSLVQSSNTEYYSANSTINDNSYEDCRRHTNGTNGNKYHGEIKKEVDLELRLGCGSSH